MKKKKTKKIKKEIKTLYACGITWQHEFGEVEDLEIFSSLEELKRVHPMYDECGIVKLSITAEWLVEQDLSNPFSLKS